MNAFRNAGLVAVVALAAMFLVGMSATSADAGCHATSFGGYGGYGLYTANYASLACATPIYTTQLYYYPVTVFDCYGNPVTIWKTGYKQVLLSY